MCLLIAFQVHCQNKPGLCWIHVGFSCPRSHPSSYLLLEKWYSHLQKQQIRHDLWSTILPLTSIREHWEWMKLWNWFIVILVFSSERLILNLLNPNRFPQLLRIFKVYLFVCSVGWLGSEVRGPTIGLFTQVSIKKKKRNYQVTLS